MNKSVLKFTSLAALTAIGVVLMSFVRIPYPVPILNQYLQVEISDFVVLFALLVFSFKEAVLVAVLKSLCDFMMNPVTGGIPIIAHLIALVASLVYLLAYWMANKIIRKNTLKHKICKYSLLVLFVSIIMTFANYAFLYPLFVSEISFFGIGLSEGALSLVHLFSLGTNSYFIGIVVMFFPFNLLKASLIAIISGVSGDSLLEIYRRKFKVKDSRYEQIT